ncbi:MAG: hypothetical protein JST66_07210 [Bacteroidetes bacterium]|nr:hypothetical protein [Bacteroidota bacterium]
MPFADLPTWPPGLRTRIAPTPSGLLHAGNGASFLLAWQAARAAGGDVLLRIDDLDAERVRPEYIADIFGTLGWLGIHPDRGPADAADFDAHWSQRLRIPRYLELVDRLRSGGHLYACGCSRKDIASRGATEGYDGHCRLRGLSFDAPEVAWRLRIPEGTTAQWTEWAHGRRSLDLARAMGDPVVRQRDGRPAYQVASLADDNDFGITFVVRGEDLLPSTACQLYIASLLELPDPGAATFMHHPLLRDAGGEKLAKSRGAGSLRALREAGEGPEGIHRLAEDLLRACGAGRIS